MTAVTFTMVNHHASADPGLHKDYWIAVTDQGSEEVRVYDPEKEDWNQSNALKWSWAPTDKNGFGGLLQGWGLPSDVKLREGKTGGKFMVVTDSRGLAALVPYPSGNSRAWGVIVGGNPHAAELLPDGNVAVAASAGGWEPILQLKGTPAAPVLEEVHRKRLPTNWGHDLFAVYGDTDKLWVTSNTQVYQYSKSTDSWSEDYPGAAEINHHWVKSVGNQPSGQVVMTNQKEGTKYTWTTDAVDLYQPADQRLVTGGAFYKARVWNSDYQ
ncbi:hypothetical protein BGX30_004802 [Mortierella sp. GBA39]|nr:hypothetical protein BGX30_004802 [Mortierella sp. GBA39]